jgi:hypothetical protein
LFFGTRGYEIVAYEGRHNEFYCWIWVFSAVVGVVTKAVDEMVDQNKLPTKKAAICY